MRNNFVRLQFCCHVWAVVKHIGKADNYNKVISNIVLSQTTLAGQSNTQAGKIPGQRGRKGGRVAKPRPSQSEQGKVAGGYTLIRRTNRHHRCNGCKGELTSTSTFIIRHYCVMPFPQKHPITVDVYMRTATPANHHFHPNHCCVVRSTQHKSFHGHVTLDTTIQLSTFVCQVCSTGELTITK